MLWALTALCALLVYFFYDLPDIDNVRPLDARPGISVLANDGTLIARYGGLQGDDVTMKDVPRFMVAAVMAVEDRRFYSHFGIDPLGMARAMWANVRAGRWVQGGSTITQQLAKNMFLTPDKTIRRKVQEAVMALMIERRFSKDQIMLLYLNRVYFGAGAYGVDAAARTYFNKPVSRLTLWESAVLAGLLKAPSRYSPATNPDLALGRARVVIRTLQDAGYINAGMAEHEIKNARIQVVRSMSGDLNRYFSDWVIDQIDSFIATTGGDIVVKTTLDPKLQLMAEAKQKALFRTLKPGEAPSQAALVTEAKDGAVLAMIGGVDYNVSQFNRATQALRQPGSSFKPFVYLAALEAGHGPDDTIEDSPMRAGQYRPENYEGKYFGTVTLTDALAHSMNTATIRLLQEIGVGKLLDVVDRLGFTTRPPAELSIGLGTNEVNLLELTNAYAVIGNGGNTVWPYAVLSIKDSDGTLLYQHAQTDTAQAFSGRNVEDLDGMLQKVVTDGTGKSAQLSHGHVAGKTGTTQDYRDAWFIGYTDNLVTGIWMGNDDNTPMAHVTGGKYPAQLWRDYMNAVIDFDMPVFRPEPVAAAEEEGFSEMINRWSLGGFNVTPPRSEEPVYNH